MPDIDLKSFAPGEPDRNAFRETFFGSLVGQAAVLVSLLVFYVGGLAALVAFAGAPLRQLRIWLETDFGSAIGAVLFYALMVAPLVSVLLFSALPFALRSRAEARARRQDFEVVPQPQDSPFRLTPYGLADAEIYGRLDGRHEAALRWLERAPGTVLHLSGESGVGKSSLIGAFLLPKLTASGWAVLEMRPCGDASARLSDKLLADKALFPRKPKDGATTRDLLEQAAERRVQGKVGPLLVMIDQFEELLILNDDDGGSSLRQLVEDLAARPVNGLKILIVYRSDYETELFKFDLPAPVQGENAFRLGLYNRGEAEAFLKAGGRLPGQEGRESLFQGLNRIEEMPGLFRQITLNMVGLFLERMGDRLIGDPGRLIQTYLEYSLTEGEEHVVAARFRVLDCLITDAGTKRPRTESDIISVTRLPPHMVRATLHGLAGNGLVRSLEGEERIWEISHDFLAALLGRAIGRRTAPAWARLRPYLAPAAVAGWAAVAALGLPTWQAWQEGRALETIQAAEGIVRRHPGTGGREVVFDGSRLWTDCDRPSLDWAAVLAAVSMIDDLKAIRLEGPSLRRRSGTDCNLPDDSLFRDGLDFSSLETLDLSSTQIASFEHMWDLPALKYLNISGTKVASFVHMPGLPALKDLKISRTQIASFEHMPDLPALEVLNISGTQVASLEHMPDLPALEALTLLRTEFHPDDISDLAMRNPLLTIQQ